MKELHLGYLAAGGLALVLALFSYQVRRLPVTGPLLALGLGVLAGPEVLAVLTVPERLLEPLLLEAARLMLAISLIGVALRFPVTSLRPVLRPVVLLVAVVMPLAAVVTGALAVALVGLPLSLALLLGASLSPTDPVLASDVVSGMPAEEELPETMRQVLTEESGANDGLALPLVLIALAPILGETLAGEAQAALYEVVVAVVLSIAIGAATAGTLRAVDARWSVERPSEMVLTMVMAVAVLGACQVVGANGVLGVFVAGLAYNAAIGKMEREEQEALDEVANRYLVLPFFLLVGVALPWEQWGRIGGDVVLFAVAVVVLRRLPVVVALARPLGLRLRDALFVGWFGPLGASSVFYLAFSLEEGATDPRVFALGMAVVALSTVVHGVSAIPLRKLYARAGS
ncbi:MAG: cation:proton antiporter [Actinobacteria bacterium]|nr:cation:proton antiporter [Actinomycetota bacterium]MBW3646867.1 cation:proton antiporter [Actinomycetota bacterium]